MKLIWKNMLLNVFIIVFFAILTFADNCKEPCCFRLKNGSSLNFYSLGKKDNVPPFYFIPHETSGNDTKDKDNAVYSYNPCYSFSLILPGITAPLGKKKCENSAVCKLTFGGKDGSAPTLYSIGTQNNFTFIEGTGETSHSILYKVSESKEQTTVEFHCNETQKDTLVIVSVDETLQKNVMQLYSKCACPDACKGGDAGGGDDDKKGLSSGSILLITFFVILIVYFVLGVTYNFCNGAHGQELLPHSGFWTDLPNLIMEGFLYSCSSCTRRSQSNYSDM